MDESQRAAGELYALAEDKAVPSTSHSEGYLPLGDRNTASPVNKPSRAFKDYYCATNNAILYAVKPADTAPAFYNPAGSNALPKEALGQAMKYDRVKLYEESGLWSLVGFPAKKKAGEEELGYVLTTALAPWDTAKFFNQKENVFKADNKIVLYSSEKIKLENQSGSIETNDSYRVLKGTGDSFFVITSSGSSGWVSRNTIPTSNLVVKNMSYTSQSQFESINTNIEKNGKKYKLNFAIPPEELTSDEFRNSGTSNIFQYSFDEKSKTCFIAQGGKIINITSQVGVMNKLELPPNRNNIKVVKGKEYYSYKKIIQNFYGMVAIAEVLVPTEYVDKVNLFYQEETETGWYSYDSFKRFVEKNQNKSFKEIVYLSLYSRDVSFKKIKDFTFEDDFAFLCTLENLDESSGEVIDDGKGNSIIQLKVLKGNGILDPVIGPLSINFKNVSIIDFDGTINLPYKLKVHNIELSIPGKVIKNNFVNGISEVDSQLDLKSIQNICREKIKYLKYNGIVYEPQNHLNELIVIDNGFYYLSKNNIFIQKVFARKTMYDYEGLKLIYIYLTVTLI